MDGSRDLPRLVLAVLWIGALIALSLWILKPFLPAMLWATTIVVATWPLMLSMQARLWNRRWLAVRCDGALLLGSSCPSRWRVGAIAATPRRSRARAVAAHAAAAARAVRGSRKLPFVGGPDRDRLARSGGGRRNGAGRRESGRTSATWPGGSPTRSATLGVLFLQFLLTVLVTAILYDTGESAALEVRRFGLRRGRTPGEARCAWPPGGPWSVPSGSWSRPSCNPRAAGLGPSSRGLPFAAILTAVMFMLSLAQLWPDAV